MFDRVAKTIAQLAGRSIAFILAILMVLVWLISGPIFHFSDTWQLVINTGTSIMTFIMVFVIQNTQNRDTEALQLKLDELLRIHKSASNALLDIEGLDVDHLSQIRKEYETLAEQARKKNPRETKPKLLGS